MGVLRCFFSSCQEARRRRMNSLAVAVALTVLAASAGASAATNAGARIESIGGATALQEAAVAQQAPLAALRSAFLANSRGMMHGAKVRPTTQALSTTAEVKKYLRDIGVDPGGVVVQRGRLNYAGPACPGKAWTCTRARKVVQISSAVSGGRSLAGRDDNSQGQNRVECNPGTVFDPGPSLPGPGADCVIVQLTPPSGDNVATCTVEFSTPGTTQGCAI